MAALSNRLQKKKEVCPSHSKACDFDLCDKPKSEGSSIWGLAISAKAALPTETSKPQAPQARRSVAESPNAPEGRGQRARVTHEIKVRLTYGDLQRLAGRR